MKKFKTLLRIVVLLFGSAIAIMLLGLVGSGASVANGTNSGAENNTTLTYENQKLNEISNTYGNFMTELYPVITGDNVDFNKLPADSIQLYLNRVLDMYPNISPIKTIDSIHISSRFGWRINPFTHKSQFHSGIDINMPLSTKIHSTMSGTVEKIEYTKGGYGNNIRIRNKLGFQTIYAHLSTINVKKGQHIKKGQVIGTLGRTGRATGPNLHYEILQGGELQDPLSTVYMKCKNKMVVED